MQRKAIVASVALAAVLLVTYVASGRGSDAARPALPSPTVVVNVAGRATSPTSQPTATQASAPAEQPANSAPAPELRGSAPANSTLVPPLITSTKSDESQANAAGAAGVSVSQEAAAGVQAPEAVAQPEQKSAPANPPAVSAAAPLNAPINGVPVESVLVMPENVKAHVREIYARGQRLGRNPHAFSKIGDSTMVWPPFMAAFDSSYNLGPYAYLQPAIQQYSGSFNRDSLATIKGTHSWSQFFPSEADKAYCRINEGPVPCEFRLNNPVVVFIRLGANDWAEAGRYQESMDKLVSYFLDRGIVPVLGTKPDRLEGPSNTLNNIISALAAEYEIPLWNYDALAGTVPNRGLLPDRIHFQDGGPHNYAAQSTFQHGDSLEDLSALMMLDAIDRVVAGK
jgi:hypothetical protein